MQPSSSRAFQRDQERDLKHPSSVDLINTNYLASQIDDFTYMFTPTNQKSRQIMYWAKSLWKILKNKDCNKDKAKKLE
jgi:hypothetical protein